MYSVYVIVPYKVHIYGTYICYDMHVYNIFRCIGYLQSVLHPPPPYKGEGGPMAGEGFYLSALPLPLR